MGKEERVKLIKQLEEKTHSKVLVYFTGDKVGFETKIGNDVIPLFYEHLDAIGAQDKITLVLYTLGGITNAGFGIVNLIREYCKSFNVIVPFKCLSTGTLIAFGANEILMSRVGQLSPIDPSTYHSLGPKQQSIQGLPEQNIPINVEDVMGYFDLATDDAKIDSNNMLEIFKILASNVHPITLGAIKRAENQVKYMAKTLLKFHCSDEAKNSKIINELLKERFSHQYLVTRREAKDIGLPIGDISPIETMVMNLYKEYVDFFNLNSGFYPEQVLGNSNQTSVTVNQAIVESSYFAHIYKTELELVAISTNVQIPSNPQDGQPNVVSRRQIQENVKFQGWSKD